MTPNAEDIAARFVEAAETEWRLPFAKVAPAGYGSAWPSYVHSVADMNGWGTDRLAEERRLISRRLPPSAGAISRHGECLAWTAEFVPENARKILWAWAFAEASGRSFRGWCRAQGIVRQTAFNRIRRACEIISAEFGRNRRLMHIADETTVGPITLDCGIDSGMVGDRMRGATSWRADDVVPTKTEHDAARNIAIKQAKRRALLGAV